jgi:hypothetical protein
MNPIPLPEVIPGVALEAVEQRFAEAIAREKFCIFIYSDDRQNNSSFFFRRAISLQEFPMIAGEFRQHLSAVVTDERSRDDKRNVDRAIELDGGNAERGDSKEVGSDAADTGEPGGIGT